MAQITVPSPSSVIRRVFAPFIGLKNRRNQYRLLALAAAALVAWTIYTYFPAEAKVDAWMEEIVHWSLKLTGLTIIGLINAAIVDIILWTLFDSFSVVRETVTVLTRWFEDRWKQSWSGEMEGAPFDVAAILAMAIMVGMRRVQTAIVLSATYLIAFIG